MAYKLKNFYRSFPSGFTLEGIFYRHGLDMKRFATVRCADGILKLRNPLRGIH
jgi:hypothetical protein